MKRHAITAGICGALIGAAIICTGSYLLEKEKIKTAKEAVKLLYEFDSFEEIVEEHFEPLAQLMTDEAFSTLQVTNTDTALVQYLKFKNNPTKVNFIECTDNYIIYSIDCASLTYGRKFVFYYDTNIFGKINKVAEGEIRDFYKASSSISDD